MMLVTRADPLLDNGNRSRSTTAGAAPRRRAGLPLPRVHLRRVRVSLTAAWKFTQAVECLDDAHRGQLATLGEAHPEMLRTQFELAMAIRMSDAPDRARSNALLDRCVAHPTRNGPHQRPYGQSATASRGPVTPIDGRWGHRSNHRHSGRRTDSDCIRPGLARQLFQLGACRASTFDRRVDLHMYGVVTFNIVAGG
jgi:hypothetical protein